MNFKRFFVGNFSGGYMLGETSQGVFLSIVKGQDNLRYNFFSHDGSMGVVYLPTFTITKTTKCR